MVPYIIVVLKEKMYLALKDSRGNFEGVLTLSNSAIADICWWRDNVMSSQNYITTVNPHVTLTTDASMLGLGSSMQYC